MRNLLCAAVAFSVVGAVDAAKPSLVSDQELSLGGVALGDTAAVVIRKLGQPRHTTNTSELRGIRMEYPGLTVWLGEGDRVDEVLSTSKQHCTPAGVCPGTLFAAAQAKYGPPMMATREEGAFMEYPSSQSSCWLQIAVNRGAITSVGAECQP